MPFDLLANGFHGSVRTQESIGQGFIFAQQPQQQVLRLYVRRPELACFVARKKDYAPGFLRIAFKHNALPPELFRPRRRLLPLDPYQNPGPLTVLFCVVLPITISLCNQTAMNPSTQTFL